ncbi:GDP-mannose 4,6-dehydratase [Ferrimicrobium acidiphilum]|uniref:GDP-6-deoxy-D-mannose reductase n=1 Tax=Ferrimicrobium acidiphilum DSM 19497 TaxID=1121877 RepID=A0A0D8FYH4_9ACTN|nr:GDP-mannose 4,6-dehydratase [Ferrimicrobium acidiphilum]KJE78089.1 GDP-6-deoxy-D-mannose reductase [Ferrimicrobium acidiphilum DSM 19497]MCL5053278.1 GDP-mannose 4,6-dehydratase [Gammaproteobacteria bacterium]
MRALVTGSHGFVGRWLCRHLRDQGDEVVEFGQDLNLCDRGSLEHALGVMEVEVCYHLAALSHVGTSWSDPPLYYHNNVVSTANLVLGLANLPRPPRFVYVSSSEVYGRVDPSHLPISESQQLCPVSPYAASKAASEIAALQGWYGHGMPVVVVRPFNHTGPGQSSDYLIPALAARLIEAKAKRHLRLTVGNVAARRDFMDVRDVVRAYRLLALEGEAGGVYNVCSGRAVSVNDLITILTDLLDYPIQLEVDPQLLRPNDVELVVGDPSRMQAATGFQPQLSLRQTLAKVVEELLGDGGPHSGD